MVFASLVSARVSLPLPSPPPSFFPCYVLSLFPGRLRRYAITQSFARHIERKKERTAQTRHAKSHLSHFSSRTFPFASRAVTPYIVNEALGMSPLNPHNPGNHYGGVTVILCEVQLLFLLLLSLLLSASHELMKRSEKGYEGIVG